jgi:hypothetical protein
MTQGTLFSVTDCWSKYQIVRASNSSSAVHKLYTQKTYKLIPKDQLNDRSIVHVMCCEYTGSQKEHISNCSNDIDRILIMHNLPETDHYQIR